MQQRSIKRAVKAVAIARGYVAPSGKEIYLVPSFYDVIVENENKTAIRLDIHLR